MPLSKLIRSDRRRSRSSSHSKSMGRSMAASRKCLHNDLVLNPPPQKKELQNGKLINEREASWVSQGGLVTHSKILRVKWNSWTHVYHSMLQHSSYKVNQGHNPRLHGMELKWCNNVSNMINWADSRMHNFTFELKQLNSCHVIVACVSERCNWWLMLPEVTVQPDFSVVRKCFCTNSSRPMAKQI